MKYLSIHLNDLSLTTMQWDILRKHFVTLLLHQLKKVLETPHNLRSPLSDNLSFLKGRLMCFSCGQYLF